MRFRNPVEYLHNPRLKPEEISADEFFQNACLNEDPRNASFAGILIWLEDSKWVAEKLFSSSGAGPRVPRLRLSDAVNAALDSRLLPYDEPGEPLPVMRAEDEQMVSEYLRHILEVTQMAPAVDRNRELAQQNGIARVDISWVKPFRSAHKQAFRVRPYKFIRTAGYVATASVLLEPPPHADTMEEALLAAAAALFGAQ